MRGQRYAQLWRVPGAPLLLVGGVIARVGQGVTVLAWILLVRETTGSFADAALVAAAASLATAVAAPVGGRLADRLGAAKVLPLCGVAYAATQLLMVAATVSGWPVPVLCGLAALSGAAFPATSSALRAAWTALTDDGTGHERIRGTAMAAESALLELTDVVGPLLLSTAMLVAGPLAELTGAGPPVAGTATAIAVGAVCTALGTIALSRGRALRTLRPHGHTPTRGLGPLRVPHMVTLLLCAGGLAFSFGASPVALAAFTSTHDGTRAEAVAGVLIAVWSVGSVAGGLWYGARTWRTQPGRQLTWLLIGLSAGYASWALATGSVTLGAVLLVTGALIAPTMTVQATLVARLMPASMLTEAYTWLAAVNLSLAAGGSAVAGVVVDSPLGALGGFGLCAVAVAVAAVLAARTKTSPPGDVDLTETSEVPEAPAEEPVNALTPAPLHRGRTRRRAGVVVAFLACLAVGLTACSPGSSSGLGSAKDGTRTVSVTDQWGRTVTVPAAPQRVVVLEWEGLVTKSMKVLGVESALVGVDTATKKMGYRATLVPSVNRATALGSPWSGVNYERLAGLKPDVVFMEAWVANQENRAMHAEVIDKIESLGVPVIVLASPSNADHPDITTAWEHITITGEVFGKQAEATALVRRLEAGLEKVTSRTRGIPDAGRASVAYFATVNNVMGTKSIQSYLLTQIIGASNVAGPGTFVTISEEKLLALDPDVLVLAGHEGYLSTDAVYAGKHIGLHWAHLAEMRAIKSRRVVALGYDEWRATMETPIAMLKVAKAVYPDQFADIDIAREEVDFYREVYGMDAAQATAAIEAQKYVGNLGAA